MPSLMNVQPGYMVVPHCLTGQLMVSLVHKAWTQVHTTSRSWPRQETDLELPSVSGVFSCYVIAILYVDGWTVLMLSWRLLVLVELVI